MDPDFVDRALLWVLAVNGVWDLCCALSILFSIPPLRFVHMSFWKDEGDRANAAAGHLMGYLILAWGCMRLVSASGVGLEWACASYLFEGVVFGGEALVFGRMRAGAGVVVALGSFFLAFCYSSQGSSPF
jgi:hypothetical protein